MTVEISSEPMMAIGRSRPGLFDSSEPVETASKPMYAKKITPAATVIPLTPWGAKGTKFPLLKAVKATMTKNARTISLMPTMTALTRGALPRTDGPAGA